MVELKVYYEGLLKLVLIGNAMSCASIERIRLRSGYHVDRGRLTILLDFLLFLKSCFRW